MSDEKKSSKSKESPDASEHIERFALMLTDPSNPIEMRLDVVRQLSQAEDETAEPILRSVLEAACSAKGEDQYRQKVMELAEVVEELKQGPLRSAIFDRMFDQPGLESSLRFARHQHAIVAKYGRFPHRNEALGRSSTDAEIDYLNSKEAFTG